MRNFERECANVTRLCETFLHNPNLTWIIVRYVGQFCKGLQKSFTNFLDSSKKMKLFQIYILLQRLENPDLWHQPFKFVRRL
jgi:hypothetical protein